MRKVSILLMLIAFLPSFIISQFYGQQRFYDGNGIDPYRGYGGWRRQQQFPTYYDYDEPRFRGPPPPPPQFQNPYSQFGRGESAGGVQGMLRGGFQGAMLGAMMGAMGR